MSELTIALLKENLKHGKFYPKDGGFCIKDNNGPVLCFAEFSKQCAGILFSGYWVYLNAEYDEGKERHLGCIYRDPQFLNQLTYYKWTPAMMKIFKGFGFPTCLFEVFPVERLLVCYKTTHYTGEGSIISKAGVKTRTFAGSEMQTFIPFEYFTLLPEHAVPVIPQ